MCLSKHERGLSLKDFFPLKDHTNTWSRLIPSRVHSTLLKGCLGARRLHCQRQALSWESQHHARTRLAEPCLQLLEALMPLTAQPDPSQNVGDSRYFSRVQHRPRARLCRHLQSQSGTQACSASSNGIASCVREVGDHRRALIYLPFFNILSMLQHSIVDLPRCGHCQWTSRGSGVTYPIEGMSIVCLDFCHRIMSRGLSIGAFEIIHLRYTFLLATKKEDS